MAEQGNNEWVYVDRSPIHGRGLFARLPLKAGQLIGTYHGPVVEEDGIYVLWIEEDDGGWTGFDGENEMRFMNHASEPNAEMDGLHCFALQNIDAGAEITIDYGWDDS